MNATEKHERDRQWEKIRDDRGSFGDDYRDLYDLMVTCDGWPEVDLWAGSTIREWWHEEADGEALQEVIEHIGLAVPIHPTDTAEEIRAVVRYSDFIRAAESRVRDVGGY